MNNKMYYPRVLKLKGVVFIWVALLLLVPALGFSENSSEKQTVYTTAHARLAVEQAWDKYHHAALGGTLASPRIQSEMEMNLHKSRALLAGAYDAEDRGDMKTAHKLIYQILQITNKVITESQEPKK